MVLPFTLLCLVDIIPRQLFWWTKEQDEQSDLIKQSHFLSFVDSLSSPCLVFLIYPVYVLSSLISFFIVNYSYPYLCFPLLLSLLSSPLILISYFSFSSLLLISPHHVSFSLFILTSANLIVTTDEVQWNYEIQGSYPDHIGIIQTHIKNKSRIN